jgi:hypothetical protein
MLLSLPMVWVDDKIPEPLGTFAAIKVAGSSEIWRSVERTQVNIKRS